jgi:hypothetical protein
VVVLLVVVMARSATALRQSCRPVEASVCDVLCIQLVGRIVR